MEEEGGRRTKGVGRGGVRGGKGGREKEEEARRHEATSHKARKDTTRQEKSTEPQPQRKVLTSILRWGWNR